MNRVGRHPVLQCCLLAALFLVPRTFLLSQKVTRIEIMNAELTAFDQKIGRDARKLLGNVQLKHEDVLMSCDSAYFYPATGSVDAFSNIRVIQGDTLTLTGDLLHYHGNTKLAEVRDNVKLVNKDITLLTDYLNYDRTSQLAYYLGGGILTQEENRLTSGKGYFYLDTEIFIFKDSVIITNPDYTIYSDTLRYDTRTEISYFYGPTEIINEERYIYCENGWYDTQQDISLVTDHAYLVEAGRTLKGDTLYYEAEQGFGRARSNVELIDTTENMILKGNFGLYYREKDFAMITDSALMIQVEGTDTMFVHADTLRSLQNPETEEGSRILKAYYRVKIFRPDIQVMCDSLEYVEADSVFKFFGEPVLWSEENQLTATHISVVMKDQQLYRMYLTGTAMVISRKDSTKFDQMRGKEMTGYFTDNKLTTIDVTGNGQTIYYAEDRGIIVGANKTFCSDLVIYLRNNKIVRVNYMKKPDGTYYPLEMFPAEEALLADFKWVEQWRPLTYMDVFRWK
ncbi:MAG TPA: organic solvent tolerance protein OstA [Bacteroides sp.]|nr:organic solvent tolerance protein OstA [Bacteroides sp.]